MKVLTNCFLLLLIMFSAGAQDEHEEHEKYSDQNFRAPVDIPLRLSGSFGELRSNHFHSGIDFKTQGKTGIPLKAIEEGYVARIKVSSSGFGKALYINHPSGYTSVYAHIKHFQKPIRRFVKEIQYDREAYEVQIYPNKHKFRIQKGEMIGVSGNSGSSRGPHLHFEIRDTKTEEPINPLFFGFDVKDTRSPRIKGVQLIPQNAHSKVEVKLTKGTTLSSGKGEPLELGVDRSGGNYKLSGVEALKGKGKLGVTVEAYDYHDGSGNRMGVYKTTLQDESRILFQSTVNRFPFYKTRYINAHLNYESRQRTNAKYQRCYVLPGNRLPFYQTINNGYLRVNQKNQPELTLSVEDSYGNKSQLDFKTIEYLSKNLKANKAPGKPDNFQRKLSYNVSNTFTKEGIRLKFPANAFYDTVDFHFDYHSTNNQAILSKVYHVHDGFTPVHKYYDIGIQANQVPAPLKEKALVVHRDRDGNEDAEGGEWKRDFVKTQTRSFGEFYLKIDTLAPEIVPLNVRNGKSFKEGAEIRIRIKDKLAGIDQYRTEIDGQWVRMAYDQKNDLLIYRDFGDLEKGRHELILVVTDEKANKAEYNVEFIKQ